MNVYYFISGTKMFPGLEIGTPMYATQVVNILNKLGVWSYRTFSETTPDEINECLNKFNIKYLTFPSINRLKKQLNEHLDILALHDGDVAFNNLINKVTPQKLKRLNYFQRHNNHIEVYLNRIVNVESNLMSVGAMIHYPGHILAARKIINHSRNADKIPFIIYRKLLADLEYIGKSIFINKLVLGYQFEIEYINKMVRYTDGAETEIILATPYDNIPERSKMQLFNVYLASGQKLLPITEVNI